MCSPTVFFEDVNGGWSLATGQSIIVGKYLPAGGSDMVPAVYVNGKDFPVFAGTADECRWVARIAALAMMRADKGQLLRIRHLSGDPAVEVVSSV